MKRQKKKWLRSHVERCLQDVWGLPKLEVDGDGDYPYRWGTAACYVSLNTEPKPAMVRVFAHAATGVPRSGKLLREINDLNHASRLPTVYWADGLVIVTHSILASGVGRDQLGHVCTAVGVVADAVGPLLASVYGGETPLSPLEDTAAEWESE